MIVEYVGEMFETYIEVVTGDEISGKVVKVSNVEVSSVDEMMVGVGMIDVSEVDVTKNSLSHPFTLVDICFLIREVHCMLIQRKS